MKFEILDLFNEAAKVMHMDKSHDAIRSKIQDAISTQHRKDNADSGSSSYYDTPWVRDVFGNEDAGQVVVQHKGVSTMHDYKANGDNFKTSNPRKVKQAYVQDSTHKSESYTVFLDGKEVQLTEAVTISEHSEILDLQEADAKVGAKGKITLLRAGKGSSGYYAESALKQAAKDGIFEGAQMFLNHQTQAERAARPEGDITKLVGKVSSVKFEEGSGTEPARLVGSINVYPEFAPFISARKNDIGLSVRVGAEPSGKVKDGVPLVERMVYGLSVDYVTKAGAGGKIEELYESFRANPGLTNSGHPPQENVEMTDEEKALLRTLQESINGLTATVAKQHTIIDRLQESNTNNVAARVVQEALVGSGLSTRGQSRVSSLVMATVPLNEDKTINVAKLQEAVKTAVTEEKAYLQESGVRTAPVVRFMGNGGVHFLDEAGKDRKDEDILQEADSALDDTVDLFLGVAPKAKGEKAS